MDLRPKLRSAITLGVLTIMLLLGLVWGWTKMTEPLPGLSGSTGETPIAACSVRTVAKGERVDINEVTISVYNAGTTNGLATKTMQKLENRGFAPGDTGNAPRGTEVKKVQIWADDPKNPAVKLVSSYLGRSVKVAAPTGDPLGVGIVVVVGDNFTSLRQGAKFVKARTDAEVCSPN
jgi:hypothetical protein